MTDDKMTDYGARALEIRGRIRAFLGDTAAQQEERAKSPARIRRRIGKLLRQTLRARKAAS